MTGCLGNVSKHTQCFICFGKFFRASWSPAFAKIIVEGISSQIGMFVFFVAQEKKSCGRHNTFKKPKVLCRVLKNKYPQGLTWKRMRISLLLRKWECQRGPIDSVISSIPTINFRFQASSFRRILCKKITRCTPWKINSWNLHITHEKKGR